MPKGGERLFWHAAEKDALAVVLEEYEVTHHNAWSPRHYCYRLLKKGMLVPEGHHPNCTLKHSQERAFAWAEQRMVKWRESGKLPWEAVAEEDRVTSSYYAHDSLRMHIDGIGDDYYRANLWRGQETRLLVVTEKMGLYDALYRVCHDYGVEVAAIKGQDSAQHVHDLAQLLRKRYEQDGIVTEALYAGDLDPPGCDIEHSLYERLNRYGYRCAAPIRVALTLDQALGLPESWEELDLTMKADKKGGTRPNNPVHWRFHAAYPQLGGGVHIEALDGTEIQRIVKEAVSARVDVDAINDSIALSLAVRKQLTEHTQEALRFYVQEKLKRSLYDVIREPGALVDARTKKPFADEIVERYLHEDDQDDANDAAEDNATPSAQADLKAQEEAAWDALEAARANPNADADEVERLQTAWQALYSRLHKDDDRDEEAANDEDDDEEE